MSAATATGLKVLETGIWKCRFRPFKCELPLDVRARNADELIEKLGILVKDRAWAREAAKAAREKVRHDHREAVAWARAELKELGGSRFKVRRVGTPPNRAYRWTCRWRRSAGDVVEFDEPTAEALIAAVQRARADGAIAPGAAQRGGVRVHHEAAGASPVKFPAGG